jgi:hypothetical protein
MSAAMKLLPESAANLVPSIAIDALLAHRDAAVAHLRNIAAAVKGYHEIGAAIWPTDEDGRGHVSYTYREPVEQRPSGKGLHLGDEKWVDESARSVDAALWDHLLTESGLWTFFDAQAREEWRKQIDEGATPALTPDNIRATFEQLYAQRGTFFERGVVKLFRSLSWDYKTNEPVLFGKRIIVKGVTSGWGSRSSDALDDLDRAFHVLDGKPEPDHRSSIKSRLPVSYDAKAYTLETPYLRLKGFKNRNGHVEFMRPDLVEKLNLILARNSPRDLARAAEASR